MALNTPNSALPYPELTDIPNALTAFQNLALALDTKVIPKFGSSSARDSAIPAPVAGQACYRTDIKGYQYYEGGWKPLGAIICTSSTRPASPENGRQIYETDTKRTLTYDGTNWLTTGPYRALQVLGSTAASVTFSSIPTTLKTVRFTCTARHDNASVYQDLVFRVGGDSGANYRYAGQFVQNVTPGGFVAAGTTSARIGFVNGTLVDAGTFTTAEAVFQGWNSPHANNLTAVVRSGFTGVAGGNNLLWHGTATYHGSNAYTSFTVLPAAGSFIAGSQFSLEGWD